jgi:hypothetical protein
MRDRQAREQIRWERLQNEQNKRDFMQKRKLNRRPRRSNNTYMLQESEINGIDPTASDRDGYGGRESYDPYGGSRPDY